MLNNQLAMKFTRACLFLLLASTTAAVHADTQWSLDLPYASKYVFRGVQVARASIQPSIEVATSQSNNGEVYAGVWSSEPIATGQKNEFDFYVGYRVPLSPNSQWRLDLGDTAYYFPQGNYTPGLSKSTDEASVGLTGGKFSLADDRIVLMPTFYTYYDFTRERYTLLASLGFSLPVKSAGTSLNFTVKLGDTGATKTADYAFWGADVTAPYKIGPNATFTLGAHYASSDLTAVQHNLVSFTAGVTVGF